MPTKKQSVTIGQLLGQVEQKLIRRKKHASCLEVDMILADLLKKPLIYLYSHLDVRVRISIQKKFHELIKGYLSGKPLAYLLRKRLFYGYDFYVDKRVLIPRPETERLIEEAIKLIKNNKNTIIADIGTGSGNLAITLAKIFSRIKIYATDISQFALKIAKHNAIIHKVNHRIIFRPGSFLKPLQKVKITGLVANLPYLKKSEITNELVYEPRIALDGGQDGLSVYRNFLNELTSFHPLPRYIILEIGYNQQEKLAKLINQILPKYNIEIKNDYRGYPRIIILKK